MLYYAVKAMRAFGVYIVYMHVIVQSKIYIPTDIRQSDANASSTLYSSPPSLFFSFSFLTGMYDHYRNSPKNMHTFSPKHNRKL